MPPACRAVFLLLPALLTAGCWRSDVSFRTIARTRAKVNCFALDRGRIWLGTAEGLIRVPEGGGEAVKYGELSGLKGRQLNVLNIFPDGNRLLLATSAGVAVFSPESERVTKVWTSKDGLGNDSVREVFMQNRRLWAATIFGASRYDPDSGRWKTYSEAQGFPKRHIFTFAFHGGTLFASSMNGGLTKFLPSSDRWMVIPAKKGIGNTHIYDIEPSADGLWLGTSAGVNFYSTKTDRWDERVCADGFTDYTVYALKLSGNKLWFGTFFGLYRRDLVSGSQSVYTCDHGLPGREIVGLAILNDVLWVCTREGVARLKSAPGG